MADSRVIGALPGAIEVPANTVVNIDQATGLEYHLMGRQATLNLLPGAMVNNVIAATEDNSALNIRGGIIDQQIDGSNVKAAVYLTGGRLDADDATIISRVKPGMRLGQGVRLGTLATVKNSFVAGLGAGIHVANSELTLANSEVIGMADGNGSGAGIVAASGKVAISASSHVEGELIGLSVVGPGKQGGTGVEGGPSVIVVDDARVTGTMGPAISLTASLTTQPKATITLQNSAELRSGNGNLIEVHDKGELDLIVDDSRLKGDLFAAEGARMDVVLQNEARLSGNVQNLKSLTINSDARWRLMGDNSVPTLKLGAGRVSFRGEGFNTLTVGELSGRGVFDMRINLDNATGDLLNVTGQASGFHHVNIANTGAEVVPENFEALRIIHTEGGNADFELGGGRGRADLGVYSYALEQQGNDWFIVGSGKTISPSTQSALALFNVGPTIWNSELTTLRSRMGEVRGREEGGGWIRSYGNRFKASLDSGVDYQQKQHGLSFGADAPVPVGDGQLLVGLMGGYSKSSLDLSRGTSGEVDSYYLGAYGTWLSNDGYYLDGVLKVNQFHNSSKVAMSDGEKAKGDYSNRAVGGSVEFGKHIKLADDYFVEPYAQLSGVWIDGSSYTLDNGLQARTSQTQSVLGKVGTSVGRQFALKDGGVLQPYVRVAAAHEFSRNNDVKVNDQRFDNDLFGSRAELGAGVSVSLSERLQVHADFDYMKGKHVEQPWGANVGLRLAF
ncbi:autotransporter outer membrane beta-barrel domain-containing protein [Pseudomonas putida]|uniref:autotransporter outer membrane beta-barrel domain-containing protein n=1 Tax=Pseudomonas putida TaxID=303 RepID=UPI002363B8D1|nr:autotransporter outer membrane beta-barrel domain-containing protein [Pseudomonas putida]MDD1965341.1 autotransporter outer membrane beta-barrel domain-containing protein [Pseudomonas putida]